MRVPIRRLPLVLLLPIFSSYASASAPPPCIKAASSSSGQFLVITGISAAFVAGVHEATVLTVYKQERFVNEKDRLTSSGTYWGDTAQWTVVVRPQRTSLVNGCPLSLITDDGEFMVLLNAESPFNPGLQIYRRRDHLGDPMRAGPDQGVFIGTVNWRDLWPKGIVPDQVQYDSSPQWFSGGTFEFSQNNELLVHRTRWGNTVRIHLTDGRLLPE
jgi:hypothetical protein